jgi:hypothetical protein
MAVFLSGAVWPGAGQMKNGDWGKGFFLAVSTFIFFTALVVRIIVQLLPFVEEPPDLEHLVPIVRTTVTTTLLGPGKLELLGLGLVWAYSLLDAFLVARRLSSR